MKIAFLQRTVNQTIGIRYLSSIIKSRGWQSELFVQPFEKNILDSVRRYSPDIVGFSFVTGAHSWPLGMCREIKKILPKAITVFGGPGPTFSPEIIYEPSVDAIAVGEAVRSFPELVNHLVRGSSFYDIPGFWVKHEDIVHRNDVAPLVEDISSLPYPDYELYLKYKFYRDLTEIPFVVRRGCPFRCAFCCTGAGVALYENRGTYARARTVENVIAEIEVARTIHSKIRSLMLYDTVGIDKEWLADFSDIYSKRVGIPWSTSSRADLIDESVATYLAKSNCFCVSLGVETGDEGLRMAVLKKMISNAQYLEAARILHASGIKVSTSNMLFLPGEDTAKALATVDLNRTMKADYTNVFILQPYPGTAIYAYAVKAGYLQKGFKYDSIDPSSSMEPVVRLKDFKKILVIHRLFYFSVKNSMARKLLDALLVFPPNFLYEIIYYVSNILNYVAYHRVSFLRALYIGWTTYREKKAKFA